MSHQTSARLVRNAFLVGSLAFVALAGSAAALPSLPTIPALPAQGIDTPVGYAHVAGNSVDACANANTAVVQALPIPALPVPVAVPAVPHAGVDACATYTVGDLPRLQARATTPLGGSSVRFEDGKLDACADAKAGTDAIPQLPVQAPLPALPQGDVGAQACAHAGTDGANADADADTSLLDRIIAWITGLF